jgi:predicted PurR-regulated permease PerM
MLELEQKMKTKKTQLRRFGIVFVTEGLISVLDTNPALLWVGSRYFFNEQFMPITAAVLLCCLSVVPKRRISKRPPVVWRR